MKPTEMLFRSVGTDPRQDLNSVELLKLKHFISPYPYYLRLLCSIIEIWNTAALALHKPCRKSYM